MQNIQLSDTSIDVVQSIGTYDDQGSDARYLRHQLGLNPEKETRQYKKSGIPHKPSLNSYRKPAQQKSLIDRNSIFLKSFSPKFFVPLLGKVATLFEDRLEDDDNSFLYLLEIYDRIQPTYDRSIVLASSNSLLAGVCNYLWAIGVLQSKLKGGKTVYRATETQEKRFAVGDLIVNLPLSKSERFGVVQSVKRHLIHPIDVLNVTWLDNQSQGIVSSDGTNPVLGIGEKGVLDLQGLSHNTLEVIRRQQRVKYEALSHSDRLLQFIRYQGAASLSQLAEIIPDLRELDSAIRRLEWSDRIKQRSKFPSTFTLY